MSRDLNKVARYKKVIDRCCNPDCGMTGRIEVHHVVPLSHGGVDDFDVVDGSERAVDRSDDDGGLAISGDDVRQDGAGHLGHGASP